MTLHEALRENYDSFNPWVWRMASAHLKVISSKIKKLGYVFSSDRAGWLLHGKVMIDVYAFSGTDEGDAQLFKLALRYKNVDKGCWETCYEAVIKPNKGIVVEDDFTMDAILYGKREDVE